MKCPVSNKSNIFDILNDLWEVNALFTCISKQNHYILKISTYLLIQRPFICLFYEIYELSRKQQSHIFDISSNLWEVNALFTLISKQHHYIWKNLHCLHIFIYKETLYMFFMMLLTGHLLYSYWYKNVFLHHYSNYKSTMPSKCKGQFTPCVQKN